MLPKLKEEVINYEQNLEDLRRLFQESDLDHSNYLTRDELKVALAKLQIELTDV
jgi:Ca2+-binding EF-hand superfamily protein